MNVYLCGSSALACYRAGCDPTTKDDIPAEALRLKDAASYKNDLDGINLKGLGLGEVDKDTPLEVLVPRAGRRSSVDGIKPHVWSSPIAMGGLCRLGRRLYVSSPEFLFLQMATSLDLVPLIAFGMELCGHYRRNVRDPLDGSLGTQYQLPSLTTAHDLRAFVESMGAVRGVRRARAALRYVLDDSASPMETSIYLLLCLPRRLGGYGLAQPTLNPIIQLSKEGRRFTLRRSFSPDLYWHAAKLDLEYDSDEFHDASTRAGESMRRKALERMGVEVIGLTYQEVMSTSLFHATALRIARKLGKKVRPENEGNFAESRERLREEVLYRSERTHEHAKREKTVTGMRHLRDEDVLYEGQATWSEPDDGSAGIGWDDDCWYEFGDPSQEYEVCEIGGQLVYHQQIDGPASR